MRKIGLLIAICLMAALHVLGAEAATVPAVSQIPVSEESRGLNPGAPSDHAFLLPHSLQYIDDEAFAGTAAKYVILSKQVETIEHKAFADMAELTSLFIPDTVRMVSSDILSGTDHVMVKGKTLENSGFFFEFPSVTVVMLNLSGHGQVRIVSGRTRTADTCDEDGRRHRMQLYTSSLRSDAVLQIVSPKTRAVCHALAWDFP